MVRWARLARTQLWQKLPRRFRRKAFFRATALLSPRPDPDPIGTGPVIVAGLLSTASGLGEGARLSYTALAHGGIDVKAIDLSPHLSQVDACLDFSFDDGREVEGSGTLLLHINSPLVPAALLQLRNRLVKGKRIVGYWAWELPSVPDEWLLGVPFVHEIWVPSRFTANAIWPIADGRPVQIVPHPVSIHRPARCNKKTKTDKLFTVLTVFNMASGLARKNPFAAIEAFHKAFGEDRACRLCIHVSNADHYLEGYQKLLSVANQFSNVELRLGPKSPVELNELFASADVAISLHRSEGFGLFIAEAMMRGLPVLATNWSGNIDFLNVDNGSPVAYSLVRASDPQGSYDYPDLLWAEPDVFDAAAKLRRLREEPKERERLGKRAAEDVARLFSSEVYLTHIMNMAGSFSRQLHTGL